MKTARSIEEQEERKNAAKDDRAWDSLPANKQPVKQKGRWGDPARFAAWQFKPGQSGNPSGRPKHDLAADMAKAIFEENGPALYRAYLKAALKGNGYIFEALANRAFGKMKESIAVDVNPLRDLSDEDLKARIAELEAKLGVVPALPPISENSKVN